MSEERFDWVVLGRAIGTATGWDQQDTNSIILYDFSPKDGISLPSGDLSFDMETGLFSVYNDEGIVDIAVDCIEALAGIPREKE